MFCSKKSLGYEEELDIPKIGEAQKMREKILP
jgi:hypothetical protein